MADRRKAGGRVNVRFDLYRHEMTDQQHVELLDIILDLPCMVMISGYGSRLYSDRLAAWRSVHYQTMTRGGRTATEWLWMNFDPAHELHDYQYLGDNFRERECIGRRIRRWVKRLERIPTLERQAILAALAELDPPGTMHCFPQAPFAWPSQPCGSCHVRSDDAPIASEPGAARVRPTAYPIPRQQRGSPAMTEVDTMVDEAFRFADFSAVSISFSGGRTSAYMLWRILRAHGGRLPEHVKVLFANTGKERPETLDFVQACSQRWDVPVTWLEYDPDSECGTRIVNHNSASRDGAPFDRLIEKRSYLPNVVTRLCTIELKIRRMEHYMHRILGHDHWAAVIGLRADEMHRVQRSEARNIGGKSRSFNLAPLAEAGIAQRDVMAFWQSQPFDLGLRAYEGNCDLCFLKSTRKLVAIMQERPDLVEWWVAKEMTDRAHASPSDGPTGSCAISPGARACCPSMSRPTTSAFAMTEDARHGRRASQPNATDYLQLPAREDHQEVRCRPASPRMTMAAAIDGNGEGSSG